MMYKFQVTEATAGSKPNTFKVFDSKLEASNAFKEYPELKKVGNVALADAVELTQVLYQDGKPCTAKLVKRKYVETIKEVPKVEKPEVKKPKIVKPKAKVKAKESK